MTINVYQIDDLWKYMIIDEWLIFIFLTQKIKAIVDSSNELRESSLMSDCRAKVSKAYVAPVFSLFSPAKHFAHQIFIIFYY